jgi:hypothetical protein
MGPILKGEYHERTSFLVTCQLFSRFKYFIFEFGLGPKLTMNPFTRKMFGDNVSGSHRPYDFARVVRNIEDRNSSGDPLRFSVYMSEYDPVAGSETFEDKKKLLGESTKFVYIPNTSHDGWKQDLIVATHLLEKPKAASASGPQQTQKCKQSLN